MLENIFVSMHMGFLLLKEMLILLTRFKKMCLYLKNDIISSIQ